MSALQEDSARLFIAMELGREMRRELCRLQEAFKGKIQGNFTLPENLHLTLVFLGMTERRRIREIASLMEQAAKGKKYDRARLAGLGSFGQPQKAILWCGLDGLEQTGSLQRELCAVLRGAGFGFDEKPFKPHITLARNAKLSGGIPEANLSCVEEPLSRLTLFESTRQGGVLRYVPLSTCMLGK